MIKKGESQNSKLLDVDSVGEVDAGERVDDSSVAILKLRLGRDFLPESCILADFEAEVCSRF